VGGRSAGVGTKIKKPSGGVKDHAPEGKLN